MFGFLQQPYVFAFGVALLTAVLSYLYSRVTDKERGNSTKTFFKTLAAGIVAGAGLTYITSSRPEAVATEPFDAPVNNGI